MLFWLSHYMKNGECLEKVQKMFIRILYELEIINYMENMDFLDCFL